MATNKTLPSENGFDLFRWIAAITIFSSHIYALSQTEVPFPISTIEAVQVFFILSGLLTYRSFVANAQTWTYLKRRARRILPAYWGTIIFCILISFLFTELPLREFVQKGETWLYVVWNGVMLNFLQPTLPGVFTSHVLPAIDGALWTMKYEVIFYLTLPLFWYFLPKKGQSRRYVLITLYALLTILHIAVNIGSYYVDSPMLKMLSVHCFSIPCLFLSGIIVYEYYGWLVAKRHIVLPIVIILCISTYFFAPIKAVWPIIFATCIVLIGTWAPWLGVFRKLPPISYEFYLLHFPIIQAAVEARVFEHIDFTGAYISCFLLTYLFAALLHRLVSPSPTA